MIDEDMKVSANYHFVHTILLQFYNRPEKDCSVYVVKCSIYFFIFVVESLNYMYLNATLCRYG